eukprot:7826836-Pyramimonas_sp.AAC.1
MLDPDKSQCCASTTRAQISMSESATPRALVSATTCRLHQSMPASGILAVELRRWRGLEGQHAPP